MAEGLGVGAVMARVVVAKARVVVAKAALVGHGLAAASARCPIELGVLHHHAIAAPTRRQVAHV